MRKILPIIFNLLLLLGGHTFVAAQEYAVCDHNLRPNIVVAGAEKLPRFYAPLPALKLNQKNRPKSDFNVNFKILILSATNKEQDDPGLKVAIQALESMWIPYEVVTLTRNGERKKELTLDYVLADGTGRYSGLITTEFNLSYKNRITGQYESALSANEWEQLYGYVKNYRLRHVSLFTYPQAYVGVEELKERDHGAANGVKLDGQLISEYTKGLKTNSEVKFKDVWHYPVKILEGNKKNTFPLAHFTQDPNSVAATLHLTQDHREQLHFFFSQGENQFLSKYMASFWVKWLVRNIYTGKRRVYLTAQIDDVFIPTPLWRPSSGRAEASKEYYRNSTQDIQSYLDFEKDYLKKITYDPQFKIEMAFNGKGIVDYGGLHVDPLTMFLKRVAHKFNWVSHTYNHYELDHLNYAQVSQEITKNNHAAKLFLESDMHLYSTKGLVTPRISGLFNPEALRAFSDHGLNYVVGDNTVKKLAPKKNKHIARKTTEDMNGYAGLTILPRFPNDIFYNVSNPWELESLFNHLYHYHGHDRMDLEEILEKNAQDLNMSFFSYDYSMHMFHQANMRLFEYKGQMESLLSLWFKRGLDKFRQYSTLPVLSLSQDQVVGEYEQRHQYERCGLETKLKYSRGKIQGIILTSERECLVPVTSPRSIRLLTPEIEKSEYYGPDMTYYIKSHDQHEIHLYFEQNN